MNDDPHPLHSQPLAPHYVTAVWAEYFAVYPDGRRCSVNKYDALCFEEAWRKEGVRVVTSVRSAPLRIIGDRE